MMSNRATWRIRTSFFLLLKWKWMENDNERNAKSFSFFGRHSHCRFLLLLHRQLITPSLNWRLNSRFLFYLQWLHVRLQDWGKKIYLILHTEFIKILIFLLIKLSGCFLIRFPFTNEYIFVFSPACPYDCHWFLLSC